MLHVGGRRGPYVLVRFLAVVLRDPVSFADAFGWRRSGSTLLPVDRFHSSYCSSVILPSTSSCANFRPCALLLKGMEQRLAKAQHRGSTGRLHRRSCTRKATPRQTRQVGRGTRLRGTIRRPGDPADRATARTPNRAV